MILRVVFPGNCKKKEIVKTIPWCRSESVNSLTYVDVALGY